MPRRLLREADNDLAIRTTDLRITLGGVPILRGVDAQFKRRGINALIGPNGAGKTTLIKALLGLIPFRGLIEVHAVGRRGFPRLGYVPQRLEFDRGTPVTVRDLLCADRQRRPLFLGHARSAIRQAREKLQLVGAERLFGAPLGRLSGGELQRVLVALALLGDPEILLLDEPVAGIDIAGEALFCDLLVRLRDEIGLTILLVSHEMSIVCQHTDHVVCINNGTVQCQGNTLVTLTADNIERVFGYHAAIYEHGHTRAQAGEHEGHQHPHMPGPPADDPGPSS